MPNLFKITIPVSLNAAETTQHAFHCMSTADLADAVTSLGDGFVAGLGAITAFKALFATTQLWGPNQCQEIDQTTGKVIATAFGSATWVGTASGNPLPAQCSAVVTLRTALAGASFRGRMYTPPISQASIGSNGLIITANVTTLVNAYGNAFVALAADGGQSGVWSNTKKTFTELTQVEVDSVIDTQRRRARKQVGSRQSHVV